jgi:hypothetical protein
MIRTMPIEWISLLVGSVVAGLAGPPLAEAHAAVSARIRLAVGVITSPRT